MPAKLSSEQILASLQQLHTDWSLNTATEHISRTIKFDDFYQTMAFANSVAWISHRQDHHPDMSITYNTCRIDFITHSVKGLTQSDFNCAKAIDSLLT